MTKKYIKPTTFIYQVKIDAQLMQTSQETSDDPATEDAASKGFSFFFEEEIEEE